MFRAALDVTRFTPGPHLVVARIDSSPGQAPPRVTAGLTPAQLRDRFQAAAARGGPAAVAAARGGPAAVAAGQTLVGGR
jgi:hypothetical protein